MRECFIYKYKYLAALVLCTGFQLVCSDAYILDNKTVFSDFKISHSLQISEPKSVDDNKRNLRIYQQMAGMGG
jgi:hypothetical protein